MPTGRSDHTMTVLHDGSAVMFGGYGDRTYFNDIHTLTVTGTIATRVQLPGKRAQWTPRSHYDGAS